MKLATYEDWQHCVTVLCGIPLTHDYIKKRIHDLSDHNNDHTRKFIDMWGEDHLKLVIGFFEQAKQELKE
ncbi:MAG: hypothetical protein AAGB32_06160 [Pseudomonadota bacterium]